MNVYTIDKDSQTMCDKVHSREGNNPELKLRSLINIKCVR